MTHLFKLELKKFRLVQKMIISAIAMVFSILFITVSLIDSMADPTQAKDTYDSTFLLIGGTGNPTEYDSTFHRD